MNLGRLVGATVAVAVVTSCHGSGGQDEARAAVRHYLSRMVEAYRTADAAPVDPLVGDVLGRRLLGLIGVKRDLGVALDARLLDLEFTSVEVQGAVVVVETRERWYYADRKLGTGAQVGADSIDAYAMRYHFARREGRLVLDELEFAAAPLVGRRVDPVQVEPRVLHGLQEAGAVGSPAGPRPR